ncbi:MAG: serine/threonine protein kinase [Rhodomicrobium sp.]
MNWDTNEVWVDCASWKVRWEIEDQLPGGGQGNAFRARRKSDRRVAFLKTIRSPTETERRARFFREASAYGSFQVSGIPALIESNAHLHNQPSVVPYIATEFIEGPTLRKWRQEQTIVNLETGIALAGSLLVVIGRCHAGGCVHRDIKPDNIILAGGDPLKPVLLDFGLSYHDMPGTDFRTEDGQEIGNRFFRLPELAAGSLLKQDPRSDLSFVAGILFYTLLGEHPDIIQDAEGRLPHQRERAFARLHEIAGAGFPRLVALFDTAFAPKIADRRYDVESMKKKLDGILVSEVNQSAENDLSAILKAVNTASERRRAESIKNIDVALKEVQAVHREVEKTFNGALTLSQTAWNVTSDLGTNTLFWSRAASNDRIVSATYHARVVGDEIIISMLRDPSFRVSTDNPTCDEDFQSSVRNWILARLRAALCDPNASSS